MIPPPGLVGAALLFWGWQSGFLWLSLMLAALLEGARLVRHRWTFAQADLDRIWDLCVLLFLGAIVTAFVSSDGIGAVSGIMQNNSMAARLETLNKGTRSVVLVLQWLPLVFVPIAAAQAFSVSTLTPWSTFSLWLRRKRKSGDPIAARTGVNVLWLYFAVCLLAASGANERGLSFSLGLALLAGWALWPVRPRSFPMWAWAAGVAVAFALASVAQESLRELERLVRRLDGALIAHFSGGRGGFEPKEIQTMLGSIGHVKQSGRIVLRVEAEGSPPALLREASYKILKSPNWTVPKQDFKAANADTNLTTWNLLPQKLATNRVTISTYLSGGRGLLPVPHGTTRLEDLAANILQTNLMGVLQVAEGPGLARFHAAHSEGLSIDSPPDTNDLFIPTLERAALSQIAEELQLDGLAEEQALKKVAVFFADNFRYSKWIGERRRRRSNETALTRFLLSTRSGHCEYFATATTMLLRAAGVPARYAVGYSVQEKKGDLWVVRERHAHAWSLAWVNGAWRDVDNTPADWIEAESVRPSMWERVTDVWSDIWFAFSKWRWSTGDWKQYVIWLLVPLLGATTWRLLKRKQWQRTHQDGERGNGIDKQGLDSEFYRVERRFAERGLERRDNETWSAWLSRLNEIDDPTRNALRPLVSLHNQLRFDPNGLANHRRAELKQAVEDWLARNEPESQFERPHAAQSQLKRH